MTEEEKGKENTLSYELLKKENEELKKAFDDFKAETLKQLEDIKEVVRVSTTSTTEENSDKGNSDTERRQKLFDKLKGTF